jgi:DNA-binding transcriptional LysR family regulator
MTVPLESYRLAVFQAVADRLSFTQAAETLHLSQPSVTSHIKALEESLGVRLFDRAPGRIVVTPAGEILRAYTKELHRLSDEVLYKLGRLNGEELGRLPISASTTIAQYLLPRLLVRFLMSNPKVEVSVTSANTQEVVSRVVDQRAALGLIEGPPGTNELKAEDFLNDEILVIVSTGHPWARMAPNRPSLGDLSAERLIMREAGSGTRRVVEGALRAAGLFLRDLKVVMELDSTEAIKSGVEAGLGVGFVSRWALREEHADTIKVIRVEGLHIERCFQFIYPHGPLPSGSVGSFLRLARQIRHNTRDRLDAIPLITEKSMNPNGILKLLPGR